MSKKKEFFFVRHGQTDWNVLGKIQGHTDIPLNAMGKQEAKELAEVLKETQFDICVSSDLARAAETAQILIEGRSIPHAQDARLREISHGVLEGMQWQEYRKMLIEQKLDLVEKRSAVIERVFSLLEEIVHESVLVVTHGGLIRSVLLTLNPEFGLEHKVKVRNAGLLRLSHEKGCFRVESMQGIELD